MTVAPNAVAHMVRALGDEWTLLIVQRALLGARRYAEFVEQLPVSHAVLSARLKSLTDQELLCRREYQHSPARYEYLPTPRSRSLWPMLTAIWDWERRWVGEHGEPLPRMRHLSCGRDFVPVVTCGDCAADTTAADIAARWGPSGSWARSIPSDGSRRRSSRRRSGVATLFPQTMSVMGDRWALALLVTAFVGVSRFTDFQAQLGAPPGTVADRLSVFTGEEILQQRDNRYELTDKGRALFPVLVTALTWAQRWFPTPEGPAVILTHSTCGADFVPVLVCDGCRTSLQGSQIGQILQRPTDTPERQRPRHVDRETSTK